MSQVIVEFGRGPMNTEAGPAPVFAAKGSIAEEITSSGTSQATTATAKTGDIAVVINNGDEHIWVQFSDDPTADVEADHFIMAGTTRDFGPLSIGDKAAVVNDS